MAAPADCTLLHSPLPRHRAASAAGRPAVRRRSPAVRWPDRRHHPSRGGRPRPRRRAARHRGRTVAVADPAGRALQPERPAQRRRRALVGPAAEPVPLPAAGHRRDRARTRPARGRPAAPPKTCWRATSRQREARSPCSAGPTSTASSTPRPTRPATTWTSPPYVRDAEGLDAQVAWATWTPGEDGAPDPEIRVPPVEYRCPVPVGDVAALARGRAVWRFDRQADGWTRVTPQPPSWPRPGEVLLVNAADGGYDAETGFDLAAPGPVPDAPELLTPEEWARLAAPSGAAVGRPPTPEEDRPTPTSRAPSLAVARRAQRAGPRPGRRAPRRPRPEHPGRGRAQRHPRRLPARPRQGARDLAGRDLRARLRRGGGQDRRGPPLGQVGRQRRAALRRRRRLPPRARVAAANRRPASRAAGGITGPRPHEVPGPRPPRQAPRPRPRAPRPPQPRPTAWPSARHVIRGLRARRDVRRPGDARPARHHAHRRPGPVPARRRPLVDANRARPARPLRPLRPRLPGIARPHLRLAGQRRPQSSRPHWPAADYSN